MKTAYSFKKSILNGDVHIFKGTLNDDQSCDAEKQSLCKKVSITEGKWYDHLICLNKKDAAKGIEEIADDLCANCFEKMPSV